MKRELLIASLMFVTACSTNSPIKSNNSPSVSNSKIFEYDLYGKLEKIDNSYEFTKFSTLFNEYEPWVNLTTMQPMWNVAQEDCTTGLVEITNKSITCQTQDERLFREKGVDLSAKKTAGYVLFTAMSLGVGAALTPGAVKFNEDSYQNAVNEAKNKLLDIDKITDFSYKQILEEYNSEMLSLKTNYNETVTAYKANIKPTFKLTDKSGLFGKRNINYNNHVSITKNKTFSFESIQPVSANSLDALLFLTKNRNSDLINGLEKSTSDLNVACVSNKLKNVNYTVQCPSKVKASDKDFNVNFTIHSINYEKVLPKSMIFEDGKVKVTFDGHNFHIQNKTESYITINSLSFYHNSRIASFSKLDYEVSPLAESVFSSLNNLTLNYRAIEFSNITKSKAQKKSIKYGIALKYKVINTNQEKTLFKTKPYILSNLI
ncbi:hypothetical protein [Parendozoicomonas sp. Alg238-R29]|uniref:hypothetical protein n=1 Tax=Parendozoicomonas sp. Alg238-R29 TaxID=2993446 RepID=UPI00248D799F|nr:hypothetical protein [Parendozoicomonas sp. Alg238-R29]